MKKAILLILLILLMAVPAHAGYYITIDGQEPAMIMCRISCPGPGGFPGVPVEFDCNEQPENTEDCDIYIYTTTKKSLKNAILNLRGVTETISLEEEQQK